MPMSFRYRPCVARRQACLTLAVTCEGREVTTIEGLSSDGSLHPMQAAFVDRDAFQCGYCTPGQIMSAVALLKEGHAADDAEIAEWMSGNICRCAAYPNIRAAITLVAGHPEAAFLAGGTTEVDLTRQDVMRPELLVDISDLPLDGVEDLPDGSLRIGALARMSDVARMPAVLPGTR